MDKLANPYKQIANVLKGLSQTPLTPQQLFRLTSLQKTANVRSSNTRSSVKSTWFFFAARRYLDFLKLPIHIINKLFNTLFFPILTYCSEVWGIYNKTDYSRWNKDSNGKTHIHFCKMRLGLNKRSPNAASRNELGRLSLNLQITMNISSFGFTLKINPPTASRNSASTYRIKWPKKINLV